jgi:hypothetical protein
LVHITLPEGWITTKIIPAPTRARRKRTPNRVLQLKIFLKADWDVFEESFKLETYLKFPPHEHPEKSEGDSPGSNL